MMNREINEILLYENGYAFIYESVDPGQGETLSIPVSASEIDITAQSLSVSPASMVDIRLPADICMEKYASLEDLLADLTGRNLILECGNTEYKGKLVLIDKQKIISDNGERNKLYAVIMSGERLFRIDVDEITSIGLMDEDSLFHMRTYLGSVGNRYISHTRIHITARDNTSLRISYLLPGFGWNPFYRLDTSTGRLQLLARLHNHTPMSFSTHNLFLATGKPNIPAKKIRTDEIKAGIKVKKSLMRIAPAPPEKTVPGLQSQPRKIDYQVIYGPCHVSLDSGSSTIVNVHDISLQSSTAEYMYDAGSTVLKRCITIKNTWRHDLPSAQLWVYEDNSLLGSASMPHLLPGETCCVGYADTDDIRIERVSHRKTDKVRVISSTGSKFTLEEYLKRTTQLKIRNRTDRDAVLYIRYRKPLGWFMEGLPDPAFHYGDFSYYRYHLKEGEEIGVSIVEKYPVRHVIDLSSDNISDLRLIFENMSDRKMLDELESLFSSLSALKSSLEEIQSEKEDLIKDQNRLRQNIQVLGDSPDELKLKQRLIESLSKSEDSIEKLETLRKNTEDERKKTEQRIRDILNSMES